MRRITIMVDKSQVAFRGELSFCSNFYPCVVTYQGVKFPTSEHAFQWAKCKRQEDKDKILNTPSATEAKKIGKAAELIDNWNGLRLGIMCDILESKFSNDQLAAKLLATGDLHLEEKNYWHDYWWGTCNGKGENWLGRILMDIRSKIREETRKSFDNLQNNK